MLKCELVELPEVVVLKVHGEIDLWASTAFRRGLRRAADRQKPIFLDMKHLSYFDTAGANVIDEFMPPLSERDALVAIISPAPLLRKVLGLLGLDRRVPCFPSVRAALVGLRRPVSDPPKLEER